MSVRRRPTSAGCKPLGWGVTRGLALCLFTAGIVGVGTITSAQAQNAPALSVLVREAKAGIPAAQFDLAIEYSRGENGLPKNAAQAVGWYEKAATQGYAPAETNLGNAYFNGRDGLPKSATQAVYWWEKAAARGYARGEFALGNAYFFSWGGLPKSATQAVYWWEKAAAQGDATAESNLGSAYLHGWGGLPKNAALAVHWYEKAAAQGGTGGEFNLGSAYLHGWNGLPKSGAQTDYWWAKAAAQGYKPAIVALQELQHRQKVAVAHSAPQSAPVAPPADRQRVVQSLRSFWILYFRASNAQVLDFGAPALVRPVGFGGAGS